LGLKLEQRKFPLEVLTIEKVQRTPVGLAGRDDLLTPFMSGSATPGESQCQE
jgi:hypothetical protein